MPGDRRRELGARGERLAELHLADAGYRVLARNFRTRLGELDLVVASPECIVFCEVRARTSGGRSGPAGPLDSIGAAKRRRVRLMAREWLAERSPELAVRQRTELRFDAIGVTFDPRGEMLALEHVEDAF